MNYDYITRVRNKDKTYSYWVRIGKHQGYFGSKTYGEIGARNKAIKFRDEVLKNFRRDGKKKSLKAKKFFREKDARNQLLPGVHIYIKERPQGFYISWCATSVDAEGKQIKKHFSINKHGLLNGFKLAVHTRYKFAGTSKGSISSVDKMGNVYIRDISKFIEAVKSNLKIRLGPRWKKLILPPWSIIEMDELSDLDKTR